MPPPQKPAEPPWFWTTPATKTRLVFVGSTPLIPGIRSDVQAAYPTVPNSDAAGWGTLILTNSIPDGEYTFTVSVSDATQPKETVKQKFTMQVAPDARSEVRMVVHQLGEITPPSGS